MGAKPMPMIVIPRDPETGEYRRLTDAEAAALQSSPPERADEPMGLLALLAAWVLGTG